MISLCFDSLHTMKFPANVLSIPDFKCLKIKLSIHQKSGDPSLSPASEVTSPVSLITSHFPWMLYFFVEQLQDGNEMESPSQLCYF